MRTLLCTVDLERTEIGTLRTCARVPRARARVRRAREKTHQPSNDIIILDNLTIVEFIYFKKTGPVRRPGPAAAHRAPWYDTPRLQAAHSPADETCGAAAPPGSTAAG